MSQPIVFVVPRYGLEFAGGSETLARQLAEALHRTGTPVEVLTTCVNDMITGNNYYDPGTVLINGITVRRFPVDRGDSATYARLLQKTDGSAGLTYAEQQTFIENSLNSEALYSYLKENAERYRFCIVTPYLFGTTYYAAKIMPGRTIHIPCLHDEPFARFNIFREMLEEARGIIFNAPEEEELARKLGVANDAVAVVGCGFDPPAQGSPERFRQTYKLGDSPFLLYIGRFEPPKNLPLLIENFLRYKQEHNTPLRLVLVGQGPVTPPAHPDIINLGFLPAEAKNDALASALALVQLSVNESFSLVLMESWLQGRPVIVHRDCPVTQGHVKRSGGGWAIDSYAEFAAALDDMLRAPELADRRGNAGRQYVCTEYNWDVILQRFQAALSRFSEPRPLYDELRQRGIRRSLDFVPERYEEAFHALINLAQQEEGTTLPATDSTELTRLAKITRPHYQVVSNLPLFGKAVAWLRRQLTSHLREPYIDPILRQQEAFNLQIQQRLDEVPHLIRRARTRTAALELRKQHGEIIKLQRRITELEAQLANLEAKLSSLPETTAAE